MIEARTGRTVREIWMDDGEPAFRELEDRQCCADAIAAPTPSIVAAAGGVVLSEANRAVLKSDGAYVVWLLADVDLLLERVRNGMHRPLARRRSRGHAAGDVRGASRPVPGRGRRHRLRRPPIDQRRSGGGAAMRRVSVPLARPVLRRGGRQRCDRRARRRRPRERSGVAVVTQPGIPTAVPGHRRLPARSRRSRSSRSVSASRPRRWPRSKR